ncbi:MAG TPA: aminotransferase class V-fold PLP-dependent enzyme [Nocardioidaceae bacterium]
MTDLTDLLQKAAAEAAAYRSSLDDRPVGPPIDLDAFVAGFDTELRAEPTAPDVVLDELVKVVDVGLVASAGPRYFGFVIGGSLPGAAAADILTTGWDQCAFNAVLSPAAVTVEKVAGHWAKELLGIPTTASVGFVTGAQEANTVALAAARHHVLAQHGWDVEQDGLVGAPRITVVASEERHATIDRSLRLLGLGNKAVVAVPADGNGAIETGRLARALADVEGPTIVCLQAGNVSTGASDDLETAIAVAHDHDAWAHVDGAFGLWANAAPQRRHLVRGVEAADSWGCDAHKTLNVPYDSGLVFVSRPDVHAAAASYTAAYLVGSGLGAAGGGADFALQSSRRAHGFTVWAALRELGRDGVGDLVERCCRLASRFADQLRDAGAQIGNDVVFNQVLAAYGDDETTDAVISAVQRDGTCWMGGTTWKGRRYMRISVSNHTTTEADVDRSVDAILRCWKR